MEKPTFQQRLKDVGLFLWNHETKEFLGRGGRSWVEIGIFYFIFYGCLTGFFIATIAVFYETIDQDSPRLQGDSSLLRGNPGMGYLPMPIIESTLIRVTNDPDDIQAYENSTKEQLQAEIGLFYLVYYACLTGFFAATIAVFYETIDADNPRLQGTSSLLKANPGMGFKPMPDIDTTLVHSKINGEHQKLYIENIKKVLDTYQNQNFKNEDCSQVKTPRVKEDTACEFNYTALTSQCNEANAFGMAENKPCVLLKLNKIYGWVPKVWSKEEAATAGLPEQIKKNYTDDRIWIDCHGENPADWDNLGDEDDIQYFPQQGFPLAFFPYKKQMNYRSPLVFVKFNKVTPHVGIMVECKALAKNIEVDRTEKEGSVHFELLVDN